MSAKQLMLFPILIALACIPAFADEDLVVLTDREQYHIGETATISGIIVEKKMPVIAMRLYDPDGLIISANSVEIDELNTFSKTIPLDSPFFDKSGTYLAKFDYGKARAETTFEVIGNQTASYPTDTEIIPEATPKVLSISTDRPSYQDGDFITISGTVSTVGEPSVLIGIYDPFGTPTGFYFGDVDPEFGFSTSFLAKGGVNFKTLGTYTIKAHYGESKIEAKFEFKATEAKEIPIPEKIPDSTPVPTPANHNLSIVQNTQHQTTATEIVHVQNPHTEIESAKTQDNLSVDDVELGKMLNQIVLNCDSSEYVDSISYSEGMGPALMRLCRYDSAISYFDQYLEKDPSDVQALTNKGSALSKLGKYDDATTYYDLALKIEPNYLPAMNNKANVLSELGEYKEAISLYNSVLDIEPTHTVAQENLEKTKEKLAMSSKIQKESDNAPIVAVSVPQEEVHYEIEKQREATEIHDEEPNILEQIGSMFSFLGFNVFGFMK